MECWALSSPTEISGISGTQHYLASKQVMYRTTASGILQFLLSQNCWVSKEQQSVFFTKSGKLTLSLV